MAKGFKRTVKLLKEYNFLKKLVEQDTERLSELTYVKGIDYDRVKIQATNKFNSSTENMLLARETIEERLERNSRLTNDVKAALELLEDDERSIIESYYFEEYSWGIIAYNSHVSSRQCQRIRDKGLTKMSIFLFEEEAA